MHGFLLFFFIIIMIVYMWNTIYIYSINFESNLLAVPMTHQALKGTLNLPLLSACHLGITMLKNVIRSILSYSLVHVFISCTYTYFRQYYRAYFPDKIRYLLIYRYAGVIFGITNTAASVPGIIAPIVVAKLTPNVSLFS